MNKVASIFPPRTGSTFFQSHIPEKIFCGGKLEQKRIFVKNIGWVCEQHFSKSHFNSCIHQHIWMVSIRNPLDVAISWYFGFNKNREKFFLEDFLINEKLFFLSYYLEGGSPEDYDVICSIEYPEKSIKMMKRAFKIQKPQNTNIINQSFGNKTVSRSIKNEFENKYSEEYEVYDLFMQNFLKRVDKRRFFL
jgi:hypothetical protein